MGDSHSLPKHRPPEILRTVKRLPPFMLVHVPPASMPGNDDSAVDPYAPVAKARPPARRPKRRLGVGFDLEENAIAAAPRLAKRWKSLSPELRRTLVASAQSVAPKAASRALLSMLRDLNRADAVKTVAIWDLDARIGFLPDEVKKLNTVQGAFTFFVLQAAVPAGLVSTPVRVAEWARESGVLFDQSDLEVLELNVIADDILPRAQVLRRDTGVDMLIGLAAKPIAFTGPEGPHWNYFTVGNREVGLMSVCDLRTFAEKAGRPFATAVAMVLLAQVLAQVSPLEYHEESHGSPCLFDFNEERVTIVNNIKRPSIHPDCLAKIPTIYRSAAAAMIEALKEPWKGR